MSKPFSPHEARSIARSVDARAKTETVMIPFMRYRDPSGRPTCCLHMTTETEDGRFCQFLCSTRFGSRHICRLQDDARNYLEGRGGDIRNYLVPDSQCCLVWKQEEIDQPS